MIQEYLAMLSNKQMKTRKQEYRNVLLRRALAYLVRRNLRDQRHLLLS